ncbi:hypothetical protein AVEN_24194-1 [Araneus ventricosus]|uniref:Uncharacterized protein n=1 Tax=Araneus ventricosus TaxID=182803 RepID=A0A4Y2WR86_ARAVE|nr:hypothetical protein AVEN_24194-1 [Araneus ventricosus]
MGRRIIFKIIMTQSLGKQTGQIVYGRMATQLAEKDIFGKYTRKVLGRPPGCFIYSSDDKYCIKRSIDNVSFISSSPILKGGFTVTKKE